VCADVAVTAGYVQEQNERITEIQTQIEQMELFKTALKAVSSVMRLADQPAGGAQANEDGTSSDEHTRLIP